MHLFGNALICASRFRVQLLQNPPLCSNTVQTIEKLNLKNKAACEKFLTKHDSCADPDPGSGAFLTPGSGIRDPE